MKIRPLRTLRYLLAGWLAGGSRHCAICDRRIWRFMPYRDGRMPALPLALGIVGSDVRNFECPRCGAHDRERHLLLYMRSAGILDALEGGRLVHFAPERGLTRHLTRANPSEYVRCDLFPASSGVIQVDIQCMPFADASFDLLIANHVLEHVEDDLAAAAEIFRVLKPGGLAVLQTPYCRDLARTWQDPGITSEPARLAAYGQEDHVRLFGKDIFERICASGLHPRVQSHGDLLGSIDHVREGVNPEEPFMLFVRPS